MEGLPKSEVDRLEANALGPGPLRPRDAGTLMLLDRSGDDVRVLMGRRHMRHAFMPGKFVFPGGRTDPSDSRIVVASGLHPHEEQKLTAGTGRTSLTRARAIALSAVRETFEEAGLLIGERGPFVAGKAEWQAFADHGVRPALAGLRMIARAITPPGRVRRFDTRFLAAWREDVAVELPGGGPTDELEELVWLPIAEAKQADAPEITRTVLVELEKRLGADPALSPGGPAPCYRMVRKTFMREML
ncbi:NUDIX hydrolase [Mesorhizobium sp. VNQ89]|uniref:NUDIX hydrolase n=1 Tax=Mesorhizobium quangtriensis TaxID=3157709 RepID=UPI0032B7CFEF